MPRTFVSPNGFTILVGKDRHDNEDLTFQIAQPHDFWLHTQEYAGSHVILQWTPCYREPELDDFYYAAHLAAFYSKARNEHCVPVHVCRACDVIKPKRTSKGKVTTVSSYTIMAKPSSISQITRTNQ